MTDEPQPIGNDEIERLLEQAKSAAPLGGAGPELPAAVPAAGEPSAAELPATPQVAPTPGREPAPVSTAPASIASVKAVKAPAAARDDSIASADIELLLKQAQEAIDSIDQPHESPAAAVKAFQLAEFSGAAPSSERATLELIRDVELDLRIEFGRTQMYLEDVLKLRKGSVVPLDKLAGDPVDIFVNGRLIAKGEVLVLNDNFCVRVAELIAGEQPV